ncbi:RING-H2 finger protein ATL80 [Hibiscus syriacus]|uniref:RING-H2 finger protein ATL80 n=1 Tax=Hibiscus syriacus TaxID=106335 RepID=A0A6A2YLY6_HIBSY|nr:RING-H2 finger protein ATL80-like [Hibiscus syriacus]KAE8680346.1 RING-H2 finger protein ATL80 [Hibiscus syriacus]
MTRPFRLLGAANSSATSEPSSDQSATVNSDFVVILAALLCALICVLGLIAVARCAWLRRISGGGSTSNPPATSRPAPPANKGLKKKILKSLPKDTFSADFSAKFSDCAICLTEFVAGDEIRVLPRCGHGFHIACIDTWLGSHSSCPSCRQILVVARCQKCGGFPGPGASTSGTDTEARLKEREDDVNRFLP